MFFTQFFRKNEYPLHASTPQQVISRISPYSEPDKSGYLKLDRILLVQCLNITTAASQLEPTPYYHPESGIAVVSWSRLDNLHELSSLLELSTIRNEQMCDSEIIFHAWMKWREKCVDYLVGDFSFALYSTKEQKLFCARDHMGARPFYYYLCDDFFVCACSLPALLSCKYITKVIEEKWIAEYLTNLSMDFTLTPYKGVLKLAPAQNLTVHLHKSSLNQYFQLEPLSPLILKDSRDYVEVYREQLNQAVNCRLRSVHPFGCELSGGIDSSTVATFAAKQSNNILSNLHAFAFARLELEPLHILEVSKAAKIPYTHVVAPQNQYDDKIIQRSINILGYPVEHGNSTGHEPFYCLAEQLGVRTLMSGFGGDEFVTSINGALALRELLENGKYSELYKTLPGNALFRFLRLAKSIFKKQQKRFFGDSKYAPQFYDSFNQSWSQQIINQKYIERYNLRSRYFDNAKFDDDYIDLKKFTIEKRWGPFVPTRMENCSLMAASRKIEYSWPLLDVRLIKLFMSIPSKEHYFRGIGRYLHRRATAGVVPDLITWKKSKNMGSQFGLSNMRHNLFEPFKINKLHPSLIKLIDVDTLAEQIQNLASFSNNRDHMIQARKNILAVLRLDHWLKQHIQA